MFKSSERMLLAVTASALGCLLISILLGIFGAMYYIPPVAEGMVAKGVSLVQIRPIHTTFASAWIFLGGVACMTKFLADTFGEPTRADRLRFRVQMVCWGLAGLGILISLSLGVSTGREYLGFHPVFSVLILTGWLLFAWTFLRRVLPGFWGRPVYVYMWTAGVLYFIYTFSEGHAWLLPWVRHQPVADIAIQWKSCGTLVASFNQIVYGCLIFTGERISGDKHIAQSKLSFSLFGIGLLNSFTNYAHHTYHLPQSDIIKWVAFLVSMLEIIILVQLFRELTAAIANKRKAAPDYDTSAHLFGVSKKWTFGLLMLALLISVPPLNTFIHGTHVVMAHAMGSELAIDSYILFGVFAWMLCQLFPKREVRDEVINAPAVRSTLRWLNVFLVCTVLWLIAGGLTIAATRYRNLPPPAWMVVYPYWFAFFGLGVAAGLLRLVSLWLPLWLRPSDYKVWSDDRQIPVRRTDLGKPATDA